MGKSFNISNPVMDCISKPAEQEQERPKRVKPERKSRQLVSLLKPSLYQKLKDKAEAEGVSVNEMLNIILEEMN